MLCQSVAVVGVGVDVDCSKTLRLVHIQRLRKQHRKYGFIAFLQDYSHSDVASHRNRSCKNDPHLRLQLRRIAISQSLYVNEPLQFDSDVLFNVALLPCLHVNVLSKQTVVSAHKMLVDVL